jgi:glutaredoxin-related protein
MDWDRKKSLIESKKLQGLIKKDQVSFTESTENLVKFLESPDAAKLFQPRDDEVFERVK